MSPLSLPLLRTLDCSAATPLAAAAAAAAVLSSSLLSFSTPPSSPLSLSRAPLLFVSAIAPSSPLGSHFARSLSLTPSTLSLSPRSLSLSLPLARSKKKKKLTGRLLLRRALGPAQQRPPWHARRPLPGRPLLVQARMHGHRPQHAAAQADPRPRDGRRRPGRDVRHRRPLGRREIHAARDPFRVQAGRKDRGGHLDERPRRRQAVPPRLGVRQPGE